jgi:hypothetical protein
MKYEVEMASCGMKYIHTKFQEDWFRRSSNIKVLCQEFDWL